MGRRFTVLIAAFAVLAGTALAGCVPPGGPGSPLTRVTPSTNLGDGDLVNAVGTGFLPNAAVFSAECFGNPQGFFPPDNCDPNSIFTAFTDGNGAVQLPTFASRKLVTFDGNHDCVVQHCNVSIAAVDLNSFEVVASASAPISFDPNKPLAPPLHFSATVATDGLVFESNGVAILHGKLTCNRGAIVDISGRFSQAFGRFLFRTDFFVEKLCPAAGTFDYAFLVEPDNGLYAAGPASVRFSAEGFTPTDDVFQSQTTQPVTLTAVSASSAAARAALIAPTQEHSTTPAVGAQLRSDPSARSKAWSR